MPLIILAVGILLLFFLIVRVKLNSFISLLIVAGLIGYAEGLPVGQIIPVIQKGLGGTLGGLAIVVSFGAILGKLMAESGGAQRIAMTLIHMFGREKASGRSTSRASSSASRSSMRSALSSSSRSSSRSQHRRRSVSSRSGFRWRRHSP